MVNLGTDMFNFNFQYFQTAPQAPLIYNQYKT